MHFMHFFKNQSQRCNTYFYMNLKSVARLKTDEQMGKKIGAEMGLRREIKKKARTRKKNMMSSKREKIMNLSKKVRNEKKQQQQQKSF